MPVAKTRPKGQKPAPPAAAKVALVGSADNRARIGLYLEHVDLAFDAFDDVDMILAQRMTRPPSIAILSAENTTSKLFGQIEDVARRFRDIPILVVCHRITRWQVRATLAAGAAGIVRMSDLDVALGPCVHAIQAGQICVPRAEWQHVEPQSLSSREKQILGLVVMGFMNGEIAQQLFLAESTVKSHLSSAFAKLGVRSRNEAVALIIDPDRGLGMGILAIGGTPIAPLESEFGPETSRRV